MISLLRFLPLLFLLPTSKSAATLCGLVGTHLTDKISFYMGNFFYKGPTTFALCASYCKKDAPKCKSFRYSFWADANAQYCEFFSDGLDGNVTADKTQPYWYYDIACAFPVYAEVSTVLSTLTAALETVTRVNLLVETQTQTQTITATSVQPAITQKQTITQTITSTTPQLYTVSQTSTQTQTLTLTTSLSITTTATQTQTQTRTLTATATPTQTLTQTRTLTRSATITQTSTRTQSLTMTSYWFTTTSFVTATVRVTVGAAAGAAAGQGAKTVSVTVVRTATRTITRA